MTNSTVTSIKDSRWRLNEKYEMLKDLIELAVEGYGLDTFKEKADSYLVEIYKEIVLLHDKRRLLSKIYETKSEGDK